MVPKAKPHSKVRAKTKAKSEATAKAAPPESTSTRSDCGDGGSQAPPSAERHRTPQQESQWVRDEMRRLDRARGDTMYIDHFNSQPMPLRKKLSLMLRTDHDAYNGTMQTFEAEWRKDAKEDRSVEGWVTLYEVAQLESIPTSIPDAERLDMARELTSECEQRPHENNAWAKRNIIQVYWEKGQHLTSKRQRGKSVGWNKTGEILSDEMSSQRRLMNEEFDKDFATDPGMGNPSTSSKKKPKAKAMPQEKERMLVDMSEADQAQYDIDKVYFEKLKKYKSCCNTENKILAEFQMIKTKYGKPQGKHDWLPASKVARCEASLKKLKAQATLCNSLQADLEDLKNLDRATANDDRSDGPIVVLANMLEERKATELHELVEVMNPVV